MGFETDWTEQQRGTTLQASWLTPYQTRRMQSRHGMKHHLMLLTDSFVRTKDSKLRNLLNKKYRDILKPLPDIPRKGKASLFFWAFLKGFSEALDSSSREFRLDLRVCSWREHRNSCEKTNVDPVQREGNFSGPVSKYSNCWLSFAIRWYLSVISGLLANLWLPKGLVNPAA